MGKTFKDKLKNVGDFISGTIAEVEKQGKDKLERGADRGGGRWRISTMSRRLRITTWLLAFLREQLLRKKSNKPPLVRHWMQIDFIRTWDYNLK